MGHLQYDPETGEFTWLTSPGGGVLAGDKAGGFSKDGYRRIRVGKKKFLAHRLAFFLMLGKFPEHEVDHANMDTTDNRWRNLREATHTQNNANRRLRRNSASRLKGVTLNRRLGKWIAQIQRDGNKVHLGVFDCPAAAHFSYVAAAQEKFAEYARGA
jgi:hypothetical protein